VVGTACPIEGEGSVHATSSKAVVRREVGGIAPRQADREPREGRILVATPAGRLEPDPFRLAIAVP
jgi:hypothetical protein